MFKVHQIPALETNYALIVECTQTGEVGLIDAPEAKPIQNALNELNLKPSKIFVTHRHADHIDGIAPLREHFDFTVYGPKAEADQIPDLDIKVEPGAILQIGAGHLSVLSVPGHTSGHIAFFLQEQPTLFAGDALFSLGCGRMFDGPPEQMWPGIKALRDLPDQTQLYCGHEYTVSNGEFALSIDPDNEALQNRVAEAKAQIERGEATLPSILGNEKQTNPFMRSDSIEMAKAMKMDNSDPIAVFAAIRKAKDRY